MEKLIALKHKLDAIKAMGTNAKKEALASMDDFEQRMVSLMLNPFVRFGVKKYKVADPLSKSVPSDQKAIELLEKLAARELTGNAAINAVENVSEIKSDARLDDCFFGCRLRHRDSGDAQLHQRLREARADGKTCRHIPHHRHY